jgi:excisionase family DNA binding protein
MSMPAVTPLPMSAVAGDLLTPREVAKKLRVSPSMVRKLSALGELPALYIGRLPRFAEGDVAAYLERQRKRGVGR